MDYLKELQEMKNNLDSQMVTQSRLKSSARSVRKNVTDKIQDEILNVSTISHANYKSLKQQEICINTNHSLLTPIHTFGQFYDLTEYNDGSDIYYPYVFGKTLEHNATTGFVKKADADKLINAISLVNQTTLEAIPQASGAVRKFEGVPVSHSLIVEGNLQFFNTLPNAGDMTMESNKTMFEMMEVYSKALLRDTPFINYSSDETVSNIVGYLNNYSGNITAPTVSGNITSKTLFRGSGQDELYGPYVSQFLLHSYLYGNLPVTQKYYIENDSHSALSMADWLNVQQGITAQDTNDITSTLKYPYDGRSLASMVHRDPFYQFYYTAALVANTYGLQAEGYDNSSMNTSVWLDGGTPAVLGLMAEVSVGALKTAWFMKYDLTLRIRPEVYAQRITLAHNDASLRSSVSKLSAIYTNSTTGSDILSLVNTANVSNGGSDLSGKNYYLDVLYREGSPTHPSFPAGHAVVAGACATVLKAMIKTHESGSKIAWIGGTRTAVQASADGDSLVAYTEDDASNMTIVGELNKLASNIALGRDFAGVHYRCDGDNGILAGEEFAISFLQKKISEFGIHQAGLFNGLTLEKFDGTTILITADAITTV